MRLKGRKRIVAIGITAAIALWWSADIVDDQIERIRHPLFYLIEHSSGTGQQIEQVVKNYLAEADSNGADLAQLLQSNRFQQFNCTEVVRTCFQVEFGFIVFTKVFVEVGQTGDPARQWHVDDVRVSFTGP